MVLWPPRGISTFCRWGTSIFPLALSLESCVSAMSFTMTRIFAHNRQTMILAQVGLSLRPRHWENLKYSLVKAPDSRTFDIFHAMIRSNAFDFIEKGRRAGEDLDISLCDIASPSA